MDFFTTATSNLYVYGVAAAFTVFTAVVAFLAYKLVSKRAKKEGYLVQLDELIDDVKEYEKESSLEKWNSYWSRLFKSSGIERYGEENNKAGFDVIILFVVVSVAVSVIFRNILVGPVIAASIIVVVVFWLKGVSNKKEEQIFQQLSGFLFAFKANIDARRTPQEAFIKIVDELPSPLREELVPVKQSIIANRPFNEALEDLRDNSSSKDLRFLAACILQANSSGGDLKEQITTIQKVLKSRQVIKDEISKGYKTARPVIVVSSFVLPGLFTFMMFQDENSRNFWFVDPISIPVFFTIVALYLGGIVASKRMVDKLKKY